MEEQQKPDLIKEITDEYERKLKQQRTQLKGYAKKTKKLEQKIEEQNKKIEEYECALRGMAKEKEDQMEEKKVEPISPNPLFDFLNEKNFEITRNCPDIIDGMANLLYKKEHKYRKYPLEEILSLESRRQHVIDYIEYARINWYAPYSGHDIQQTMLNWFYNHWQQFLYNPSKKEKEKSRKMFLNKFNLKNTIGTVHYLPIQFRDGIRYYSFAISDYRIVYWTHSSTQQVAYSVLHYCLKYQLTLSENSKFATEMEVNDKQLNKFIHTSNKDVFVENEKVMTWIKNNFDFEKPKNDCIRSSARIIPPHYNFFVNFYDSSSNYC